MAFTFEQKKIATLKAKDAASSSFFTVAGVNASLTSADDTVAEVNKILAIGGLSAVANEFTELTIKKGAVDNG